MEDVLCDGALGLNAFKSNKVFSAWFPQNPFALMSTGTCIIIGGRGWSMEVCSMQSVAVRAGPWLCHDRPLQWALLANPRPHCDSSLEILQSGSWVHGPSGIVDHKHSEVAVVQISNRNIRIVYLRMHLWGELIHNVVTVEWASWIFHCHLPALRHYTVVQGIAGWSLFLVTLQDFLFWMNGLWSLSWHVTHLMLSCLLLDAWH